MGAGRELFLAEIGSCQPRHLLFLFTRHDEHRASEVGRIEALDVARGLDLWHWKSPAFDEWILMWLGFRV